MCTVFKKNKHRINDLCLLLLRRCYYLYLIIIWLIIESCSWEPRNFYVEQLDVHIDIEHLKNDHYRVYVYRHIETMDRNYIDLYYHMSEMPCITLYFPIDDKDKIFIIDNMSDVRRIVSDDFKINLIAPPEVKNGELLNDSTWYELQRYNILSDSINNISSVKVRIDAFLRGLTIWIESDNWYRMEDNS